MNKILALLVIAHICTVGIYVTSVAFGWVSISVPASCVLAIEDSSILLFSKKLAK